MGEPIEVPDALFTVQQLMLIGRMCGRALTVPEFDLFLPDPDQVKYGYNRYMCHCLDYGWIWVSENNADGIKKAVFTATLNEIRRFYDYIIRGHHDGIVKDGIDLELRGRDLALYFEIKMPVFEDLLDKGEPVVVQ